MSRTLYDDLMWFVVVVLIFYVSLATLVGSGYNIDVPIQQNEWKCIEWENPHYRWAFGDANLTGLNESCFEKRHEWSERWFNVDVGCLNVSDIEIVSELFKGNCITQEWKQ